MRLDSLFSTNKFDHSFATKFYLLFTFEYDWILREINNTPGGANIILNRDYLALVPLHNSNSIKC